MFFLIFLLLLEGSGSVQINYGSGCGSGSGTLMSTKLQNLVAPLRCKTFFDVPNLGILSQIHTCARDIVPVPG